MTDAALMNTIVADHELLELIERLDAASDVVAAVARLAEVVSPEDDDANAANVLMRAVWELIHLTRSTDNFFDSIEFTRDTIQAAADYLAKLRSERNAPLRPNSHRTGRALRSW